MAGRYDDPLAEAIYVGRKKALGKWGEDYLRKVPWPSTREERATLEHNGGNAEMDLAISSAKEVRRRGLA